MKEIKEFDLWMQEVMSDIGFSLYEKKETTAGYIDEWKFYDPCLGDKHWTMVIFRSKNWTIDTLTGEKLYSGVDYRLYVHWNDGGRFHSSPFQMGIITPLNRECVRKEMESLFADYFRDKKLDILVN